MWVRMGLGAVAIWALLITINPFLNSDPQLPTVSGRLGLLAYLLVAILLPGFFWLIVSNHKASTLYIAAAILPLLFFNLRAPIPPGLRDDYLRRRQLLIQSLPVIPGHPDKEPLVMAAHGDQFVVTSTLAFHLINDYRIRKMRISYSGCWTGLIVAARLPPR